MENIFNNNIKVLGGVSADTLTSPTLETKVDRHELDVYVTKEYVKDALIDFAIKIVYPKYTGSADATGLKAIGWTDEDIAYYQKHGVNWNEEEDHLHKVPQNNIDLYGTINATNIDRYRGILVYLPKIDTSKSTYFGSMFYKCSSLISIPLLDTSNGTDFNNMFANCTSLTSIPLLDISNGTNFNSMFFDCLILSEINLKGLPKSIVLNGINQVTIKKESILFIINNSTATSAITIRLDANNYNIYSVDADVIAALTLKPLVTLIK